MTWYEGWFDSAAYDLVYDHRDETEAEQLIDLIERDIAPAPAAHILDVGCGRGRHSRILARRGYTVTGIDLSEEAITEARARAQAENLDVMFERGDMRDPYCDGCMDGVVNLFTTFGYFATDAENQRALAAMTQAVRPDGWFLQDFLNAPHVAENIVPTTTRTVKGVDIEQHRWIEDDRIKKEITLHHNGSTKTYHESVRLYTLDDLQDMYASVGLTLVDTYGNYDGAPHTPKSPRLLLYARKPSD
ncbi:SAM-dependent methyltransferase [Salinibacter sp. 10B]|uniref:class I SAM-dependent methyltransferase n=1 Tax=Salinibacter sp. 10B TaxID=1923971 RepID=UPI000CF4A09E|nr:class I SAM-dependent methyltransferase [Salinibacter sp. 10B]PQJ33708.1 SAM-dependent methyltransferase [Salinibacter sp. 10B]